jgi:hypothetical protein
MRFIVFLISLFVAGSTFAQRDLTPGSKRDAFGTRDLRQLNNYGLQFQIGGTYLMTKLKNEQVDVDVSSGGFRGNYTHDPFGRLGLYGEIGMFHFPKKRSKLSLALKTVLVSYFDWGVGFKYFRGGENIEANFTDALGTVIGSEDRAFNFSNGNVYGRFSLHKNINFKNKRRGEKTRFFLDNSLGLNLDYRVMTSSDDYSFDQYGFMTAGEQYTKPLQVQLFYGLGFGFRLKRGSWLIPGVRIPIVGYQQTLNTPDGTEKGENKFGRPSLHWYSSRHWPLLFHVKYMFAFEKKAKRGCPPVEINSQDQETQQNR